MPIVAVAYLLVKACDFVSVNEVVTNLSTNPTSVIIPPSAVFSFKVLLGEVAPPHAVVEEVEGLVFFAPLCSSGDVIVEDCLGSLFIPHLTGIESLFDFLCKQASNPDGEEDYSVDLVTIPAPPLTEGLLLGLAVHGLNDFFVHHGILPLFL